MARNETLITWMIGATCLVEDKWNQDRFENLDPRCRLCKEDSSVESKFHLLSECAKTEKLRSDFMKALRELDRHSFSVFFNLSHYERAFWILNGGRRKILNAKKKALYKPEILKLCAQFISRIDRNINSPVGPPASQGETSSMLVPESLCNPTDTNVSD